ncbi:hypothetical protein D3C71_1825630 [compost metagenome]
MLEFLTGKNDVIFNSSKLIICSELIDRTYLKLGIDIVKNKTNGDATPKDISEGVKTELFEKIL